MRTLQLAAVSALSVGNGRNGVVGAAHALAGLRGLLLGNSHLRYSRLGGLRGKPALINKNPGARNLCPRPICKP